MRAGPRSLKIVGGLGTLVMCGTSGLVVASNSKPPAAPLHPPVDPSAPFAATGGTSLASAGSLTIPITPTCARSSGTSAASGGSAGGGAAQGHPAKLDPAIAQVLLRLRQATTGQARQQVLQQAMQQLSADQRLQLSAVLAARGQSAGSGTVGGAGCRAAAGQPTPAPAADIAPSVVDAAPSTAPVSVSAVS
jgi:hypothetical protein